MPKKESSRPTSAEVYLVVGDNGLVALKNTQGEAIDEALRQVHLKHSSSCAVVRMDGESVYHTDDEDEES